MTIAAGFNLTEWIVMCSDTEYVKGSVVYDGPKIFPKEDYSIPVRTCFAIAGSVPNARQAIRKIEDAIEKINAADLSQSSVLNASEAELEKIFARLRKRSDYMYESGPQFYLLMAVSTETSTKLYANYEDVFNEVHSREFLGTGDSFARYITAPLFTPHMDLADAVGLANYMLSIIKNNVTGCGKSSDILIIHKPEGIALYLANEKIRDMEKVQLALHDGIHQMLFSASTPDVPTQRVEAHVSVIVKAIREMKRIQQENKEKSKKLVEQIYEKGEGVDALEKYRKLKISSEELLRLWVAMQ